MAGKDQNSEGSTAGSLGASEGQEPELQVDSGIPLSNSSLSHPGQSPLYHAEHSARYERQDLIKTYEEKFNCRLVAMVDAIFGAGITFFEELIYDASPDEDLHLLLASPGGDGEVAVRIARSAQARCRELTVIVPDQAKSAATILAMGAHHIIMGPTSDLGPVDPQFQVSGGGLVAAKDIIAAVTAAEEAIAQNEAVFPLHAALLSDVSALKVQQARAAIDRTDELVDEALRSQPDRTNQEVESLKTALRGPLIAATNYHGAIFGAKDAQAAGLPVKVIDPQCDQWRIIWRLWSRYFLMGNGGIYEGRRSSRFNPYNF